MLEKHGRQSVKNRGHSPNSGVGGYATKSMSYSTWRQLFVVFVSFSFACLNCLLANKHWWLEFTFAWRSRLPAASHNLHKPWFTVETAFSAAE